MDLRSLVKKSILASCLYYLADDWRIGRKLSRGDLETTSGTRHADSAVNVSVDYIRRVYNDYRTYAGIRKFRGIIGEIGPGDNFGVAMLLLANGADAVHAIDRYYSKRDSIEQRHIYEALAAQENAATLFDGSPSEDTMRGLHYHPGIAAEEYFNRYDHHFDAILSRAVLEHLYDPISALNDMTNALKPGGQLVHRIDLRDHGMFAGHHSLTFLTINDSWYRRMTAQSGRPNRVLVNHYRNWLDQSSLNGEIRVTRLAGVDGEIRPSIWKDIDQEQRNQALDYVTQIQNRLTKTYRSIDPKDLAVAGIILVATKPQPNGT